VRLEGAPNVVIAHDPKGKFDLKALRKQAQEWSGLEGLDLVPRVTREGQEPWGGAGWKLGKGYGRADWSGKPHVVAIDYGAKDNIFRNLAEAGAKVTVVPARTSLNEIMALKPDGVFLSIGPRDPAATGKSAVPEIEGLLEADVPTCGLIHRH